MTAGEVVFCATLWLIVGAVVVTALVRDAGWPKAGLNGDRIDVPVLIMAAVFWPFTLLIWLGDVQ